MSAQELYDELQSASNSRMWALAKEFYKLRKDNIERETTGVNLEDKVRLRQDVLEHLYTESSRGNAQASDKLAKLAGLSEDTADIIIEAVDFGKVKWT